MNFLIAENDFALVGVLNVSKPKAIPWSLRVTRSNPCPCCEDREYHAAIVVLTCSLPKDLPILVLASHAGLAQRVHVLDCGADDVVQKPLAFLSSRLECAQVCAVADET